MISKTDVARDQSIARPDEAENRLTAQMAILVYFTHKDAVTPSLETIKRHEDKILTFLSTL
ncbi:hypothetical protein F0252_08765 [Vibrio hepatarius]|nr:hypothetical protein [Vibrio hepatarius]NOI14100.1 hypothetical protein [Vibrio hepatarius]